ncbi:pilus assembly protein N-terminal domain-containing protein [Geobacter hydrogenophilus]|uniref:General secretion pathway protein n=1 Tax=Geobacter hydrogenophilus TaxID=40983 RepID=A0A9W6LCL0_9BACT|nr:pilus assembly protein N-terminal domain-containing protein [Geobacter hydrogenophilus]MBT0893229.1 pilus assembly protein N-terminal domain-containing protein [Geobacter hydrogenophilus]GLI38923.1 general secretion pathway protein [Geobacter hydrogenophilus]
MNLSGNIKRLLTVLASVVVLISAVTAEAGIPTEVTINKSVLLNLKNPAVRVSVANPAIADLTLISPKQILINGTTVGVTTILVWEKGNANPSFFDLQVLDAIELYGPKDNRQLKSQAKYQVESQIHKFAPNIEVEFANKTIVLTGTACRQRDIDKAKHIADAYAEEKVVITKKAEVAGVVEQSKEEIVPLVLDHIQLDDKCSEQVLLQVKVAQVDKTALKKLGFSAMVKQLDGEGFTNLIGAPSGSARRFGTGHAGDGEGENIAGNVVGLGSLGPLAPYQLGFSYFPEGIGAVLQALSTKGYAKILAEPNLLVKSGQKGNFLAGSRIPYNVVTSTGGTATTSIVFVDVGVKLNFAPEVSDNGLIKLKIDPAEVSTITGTLEVNGYPIIDTRTVNTNVELKDGESLVLAGMLQEDQIRTMSKIPLLGDIPILGALFRSTENDLKEKELVFFITPKLIKPSAPGTKTELPTDKELTPEQERELQWIPTGE